MQNAQMANMAGLNANQDINMDGNTMLSQMAQPQMHSGGDGTVNNMNTYIYDYLIRIKNYRAARALLESGLPINTRKEPNQSPNSRGVNGVNAADAERGDLPEPNLPIDTCVGESFLQDWWCQFWDIFMASRGRGGSVKTNNYAVQARVRRVALGV